MTTLPTPRAAHVVRTLHLCLLASAWAATPARAQLDGYRAEVAGDVETIARKFVDLAAAMPPSVFDYAPAPGVRSTGQVLLHVAGNNYFAPIALGIEAPAGVPITDSYQSVVAYESGGEPEEIVAAVRASFAHLEDALRRTPDAELERSVRFFGAHTTARGLWLQAVVHLHEHLGQLIAYARANGITPPWSAQP